MEKLDLTSGQQQKGKRTGQDIAALSGLLGTLNNPEITGAAVPKGVNPRAGLEGGGATKVPDLIPASPAPAPEPTPPPAPVPPSPVGKDLSKIFFTGKMMSGKDWLAERIGARIVGVADPLYKVQEYFFPGTDKTSPGARAFLQKVGQWGRGLVNAKYPLSPERAAFVWLIRSLGSSGVFKSDTVTWEQYGTDENIWLDSLVKRVGHIQASNPGVVVAVTNVRFENEFKRLMLEGWTHFHVTCAPATWTTRLAKANLKPDSPEVRDTSEGLAHALDTDVTRRLSKGNGKKLRVVWCDDTVACPSPRYYTNQEFVDVARSAAAPVTAPMEQVDVGDISLED